MSATSACLGNSGLTSCFHPNLVTCGHWAIDLAFRVIKARENLYSPVWPLLWRFKSVEDKKWDYLLALELFTAWWHRTSDLIPLGSRLNVSSWHGRLAFPCHTWSTFEFLCILLGIVKSSLIRNPKGASVPHRALSLSPSQFLCFWLREPKK